RENVARFLGGTPSGRTARPLLVKPDVPSPLLRLIAPALGLALAIGCAPDSGPAVPPTGQPLGWDDGIRVPGADDINPDPNVVEVNLEARTAQFSLVPGGPTTMWTYNGMVPGPLIRAQVGNRVIVHFTNSLPEETTIHWHGLRVTAAMDGMPGESQPPVAPGGSL